MKKFQDDIAKKVMDEIKDEHIKMHPHYYFIVAAIFLTVGAIGLLIATTFLTNVVVFYFISKNPLHPLWRDRYGWGYIFLHLPWVAIILAIVGIWIGLKMLHHFAPLYKRRSSEIVGILILIAVLGGVFLNYIGVNEQLHKRQVVRGIIYSIRDQDERWLSGEVTDISPDKSVFTIKTPEGTLSKIIIDSDTKIPPVKQLEVGSVIHVIAQCEEAGVCHAKAIGMGAILPPPMMVPDPNFPRPILKFD